MKEKQKTKQPLDESTLRTDVDQLQSDVAILRSEMLKLVKMNLNLLSFIASLNERLKKEKEETQHLKNQSSCLHP